MLTEKKYRCFFIFIRLFFIIYQESFIMFFNSVTSHFI